MQALPNHIKAFFQDKTHTKILVAISGGADSVCLAFLLLRQGFELGLAHVNYQLRGEESEADEQYVRLLAQTWQVPIFVHRADTAQLAAAQKKSIQVVAREIRYAFFEELMDAQGYEVCATAHHADDQNETLLYNLVKGSEYQLFKGIPAVRERYLRPLLGVGKQEILGFLQAEHIPFRTDTSNLKNDYSRNLLRNEVLPHLQALNPSLKQTFAQKSAWYELQKNFISQLINPYITSDYVLDFQPILNHFPAEFLDLFIAAFCEKQQFHGHIITDIIALKDKQVGKKVLWEDKIIVRERNGLCVLDASKQQIYSSLTQLGETLELENGIRLKLAEVALQEVDFRAKGHYYVDLDKLYFPLTVRSPRTADQMQPLGMKGNKLISDIMADNKFSAPQKQNAFVITDEGGSIIFLSNFRVSERVKITQESSRIACLILMEES